MTPVDQTIARDMARSLTEALAPEEMDLFEQLADLPPATGRLKESPLGYGEMLANSVSVSETMVALAQGVVIFIAGKLALSATQISDAGIKQITSNLTARLIQFINGATAPKEPAPAILQGSDTQAELAGILKKLAQEKNLDPAATKRLLDALAATAGA